MWTDHSQMRLQYSDVPNTQNYIKEVNKMKKLFFAALIGIMLLQAGSITTKAENIPPESTPADF